MQENLLNLLRFVYVPVEYQLGCKSMMSFYCGSYAAYQKKDCSMAPKMNTDARSYYDLNAGMFENRYSAAYCLGRLLALQIRLCNRVSLEVQAVLLLGGETGYQPSNDLMVSVSARNCRYYKS